MTYVGGFGHVAQPTNGIAPLFHSVTGFITRRLVPSGQGIGIAVKDDRTRSNQTERQRLLEKIQIAISGMSMRLPTGFAAGLNSQFANMMADDTWEDDDQPVSVVSLQAFLLMLIFTEAKARPGIGTNGRGSITAFWREGENRLTIDCLPSGNTRWVLTRVNAEGAVERAAAECRPERLRELLNAYGPEVWFG